MNKLRIATIGLLAVAMVIPGAVFAQEDGPRHPDGAFRAAGEITGVAPDPGTFILTSREGRELTFQTNEGTKFRSPGGDVEGLEDLEPGMKAFVVGVERDDATLLALMVAAGRPEDLPDHMKAAGQIKAIDPGNQTFALETRNGEVLPFSAGERTKYRGEGIVGFDDLEVGMRALVAAIPQDGRHPLALLIAVGQPKDRPDVIRLGGEITGVAPDAGVFTLVNREGEQFELLTNDRTKFHSRDGSIQSLTDLKAGMHAMVGAVRQDDGQLLALVVAAGNPEDRPDRPELDVRVGGEVQDKGSDSFTLRTQEGELISFSVGQATHYKGIGGFGDLEIGMMAAVGAVETDDGLLAVFVGARNPEDRPHPRPHDRPGRSPDRRDPSRDQDVSA